MLSNHNPYKTFYTRTDMQTWKLPCKYIRRITLGNCCKQSVVLSNETVPYPSLFWQGRIWSQSNISEYQSTKLVNLKKSNLSRDNLHKKKNMKWSVSQLIFNTWWPQISFRKGWNRLLKYLQHFRNGFYEMTVLLFNFVRRLFWASLIFLKIRLFLFLKGGIFKMLRFLLKSSFIIFNSHLFTKIVYKFLKSRIIIFAM